MYNHWLLSLLRALIVVFFTAACGIRDIQQSRGRRGGNGRSAGWFTRYSTMTGKAIPVGLYVILLDEAIRLFVCAQEHDAFTRNVKYLLVHKLAATCNEQHVTISQQPCSNGHIVISKLLITMCPFLILSFL